VAQQIESRSPQDPTDVVVSAPAATSGQVRAAVDRARVASREWGTAPAAQRATALHAAADAVAGAATELAALIVREVGKPVGESRGEVARAVAILRYFAQQALDPDGETYPSTDGRALLLARHRPRGTVGLITPWNFPIAIPLWKAAPALAFGNAVVLKPAPDASAVAIRLEELVRTALPDGVLQVVTGSAEAGRALVESVDAVSFTGSASVGRLVAVAAAARGIAAQCEMGGQNPSIVLPDADIEQTAAIIANAAMGYAGQKCTATSRVIVVGDAAPFTQALVAAVEGLASGDPADEATVVGPVITEAARARVLEAAEAAVGSGGRVLTGARSGDGDGWFVQPTLVDRVGAGSPIAQDEVFGPLCALLPATDVEDALRIANGVPYGLVASVFTRDLNTALDLAQRLDVGLARINAPTSGVDFHAPFGGEKDSSYGPREQGKAARDFYTSTRTITIAPAAS